MPLSAALLLRGDAKRLPADGVVLQLPGAGGNSSELRHLIAELVEGGYQLALDGEEGSAFDPALLALAHYAVFDVDQLDGDTDLVERIRDNGARPVARQVLDDRQCREARRRGIDLFQGPFLFTAKPGGGTTPVPARQATMLALIAELSEPDFDLERAHRLIRTDAPLSYMLLQYINSAFFSLPRDVASIREAVTLLGSDNIRRFVSIVSLTRLGNGKPEELLRTAILRARFCEQLAARRGPELFTLGLFSILDVLLDTSMERAVSGLPLCEELRLALIRGRGPLAPYLALVRAYQEAEWATVTALSRRLAVDERRLPGRYRDALGWADAAFDLEDEG